MDFGWLQCLNVGFSLVKNVPFWWAMFIMGETIHVGAGTIWEFSVLSFQVCCESKNYLKSKVLKKKKQP